MNGLDDNFNITQLEFKDLPSDKTMSYVMHGNIFQFESKFKINALLKDENNQYYSTLLPINALSAFPLGTIFKNKKVTGTNDIKNIMDVKININKKRTGYNLISGIEVLKNKFSEIPDEISGYSGKQNMVYEQFVAIYKDQISGKILYVPHYEIARWFYLRSSSLSRQALSANLSGLYYSAEYTDSMNSIAELIMKHGSSNGDAAEIFRFAIDRFANIMFHEFSVLLSRNKFKNTTKIQAHFPVYGELNLRIRGLPLDEKSILVYQFLEEDSSYPFSELSVYRYGPNERKDKEAIINKKSPKKTEMENTINDQIPNTAYENKTTVDNTVYEELRKGLEYLKIKFPPLLKPDEKNESIGKTEIEVSGEDKELSINDASKSGDEDTIHTSLVRKKDQNLQQFIQRENNLTLFKRMLFKLNDVHKASKNHENISLFILEHKNLPKRPEDYKGKAKWGKSMLSNGLPRQYVVAQVIIESQNFYLLEIEHSNDEKISTLLLYKKHEIINESVLCQIVRDFAEKNGRWVVPKNINKQFNYHRGDELKIAKKLYKKFIRSIK